MNIDTTGIEYIVKKVMAEIDLSETSGKSLKDGELGVFDDIEKAIDAAAFAQKAFMRQTLEFRRKLIEAMRAEMLKKEKAQPRIKKRNRKSEDKK